MKRIVTATLLLLVYSLSLTGCSYLFPNTGEGGRDKSVPTDEVITKQIKDILKVEMDKIGFTVDLEQYGFTVDIPQTYATSGTVALHDPLYNQSAVSIYEGDFVNIEKEKVALNPVNLIVEKYQDYLLTKYKTNLEQAESYLTSVGVEAELQHFTTDEYDNVGITYPAQKEVVNGEPGWGAGISYPFLWETSKMNNKEYKAYFKGKSASTMDMADFHEVMKYSTQFYYISNVAKTKEELELLKENFKQFNKVELIFTIRASLKK